MKQILIYLKEEIDCNIVIVEDLNTIQTSMDRLTRQKLSKETTQLTQKIEQMDLIDSYRNIYPKDAEPSPGLIILEATNQTSANLKNNIIPCSFLDHCELKQEANKSKYL